MQLARVFPVCLLLGFLCPRCLDAETINFPAGCGVINVTESPFNADNTGATDATSAIQQALDENKRYVVIYFPNGTYKVSGTLRCATWYTDADNHGPMIVGQNRKNTVIRLADGTFTNANDPQPVLITGDGVAQNFEKAVHNLTISVGRNNPGANGIFYYANNLGLLSEVDVISEDGQGVKGVDLGYGEQGPCGVKSIYVKGFQYGVHGGALNAVALSQVTVEGQSVAGVYVKERYMWFDSLTSINSVPAMIVEHWDVCLVNANLRGGAAGTAAIQDRSGGMMFLRGIQTQGYGRAYSSTSNKPVAAPTGTSIDEYSSHGYDHLWNESPQRSMDLPVQYPPEVPWEEDAAKWANVQSYKGGLGVPQRTDLEAVQAAIDDPAKTTVFIPGGKWWDINDTVYVRGNTRRIVGGGANLRDGRALVITDECTQPSIAVNWTYQIPIVNRSSKPVVLQSVLSRVYAEGTGDLYIVDICGGIRVSNPAQSVWAWQFNAEGGPMNEEASANDFSLRMDSGRARILGWKDEGTGIAAICYGGLAEVIGFFQYTADYNNHPSEMIIRDGAFSLALHSELCWGGTSYSTLVTEQRGGDTRYFRDSDNGGSDSYPVFTAYRPGDLDNVASDRRETRGSTGNASARMHKGVLRVELPQGSRMGAVVSVLTPQGRLVRKMNAQEGVERVSFDGLRHGAYVVTVSSEGGRDTKATMLVGR